MHVPPAPDILPETAAVSAAGRLEIGGCDVGELARTFGTPLYVYDEATVRSRARAIRDAVRSSYRGAIRVCYASKAYSASWLLQVIADEGLGLDVVSGGELFVAARAHFPRWRIYLHGNNKDDAELEFALRERVGRVVVDNVEEVSRLGSLAGRMGTKQSVLLRIAPGVDADTHGHLQTGGRDSKFGLGMETGDAARALSIAMAHPALDVHGVHAHVGSQLTTTDTQADAVRRLVGFAEHHRADGLILRELSAGGGFAVRSVPEGPPDSAVSMAAKLGEVARRTIESAKLPGPPPRFTIEPGRSLIAPAGVALYRVGAIKRSDSGRTYVAVDGGMADNIRPTAYGADYSIVMAERITEPATDVVTITGRYCESGDILISDARIPTPRRGDVVAVPAAGAYQLSMASNYNMSPRPAVVVVRDASARLVRRRETYEDLVAGEVG